MSLVDEKFGDIEKKEFRITEKRKEIWNKIFEKVQPVIKYRYSSDSKAIDISGKLGARYIDRMQDAKREKEEKEQRIEELEQEIQDLKDKWETEEVKFHHLDKIE